MSAYALLKKPSNWIFLTLIGIFFLMLVLPLWSLLSQTMLNVEGVFVGLDNFKTYLNSSSLTYVLGNTLFVSLTSAIVASVMGFVYAYALTRSRVPYPSFFRYLALVPLFMPTVVHGLSLIYLFGTQGIVTQLGWDINLYGPVGIIISEVLYTFPQAFLMFFVALKYVDGRLYDAAESLGCSKTTTFFNVTLPSIRYSAINVFFITFSLAFTDFGAPKVVGGNFNVLATSIYTEITGHFDFSMGAVVSTFMLWPAILCFIVDRMTESKSSLALSTKATPYQTKDNPWRDRLMSTYLIVLALGIFTLIAVLLMGAMTRFYPYDLSITLDNFNFDRSIGGITSFTNSVSMSLLTAFVGTLFVFVYAFYVEKSQAARTFKLFAKALSTLPLVLPGMVIGLSFILFFNNPENPLNTLYGTIWILVLANIVHFFAVPYVTASSALKKLNPDFENVAASLGVSPLQTFFAVTLPLTMPALLEMFLFFFINSMVTVSAVVFLYGVDFRIASIAITHLEETGAFAQACALSLLIIFTNVIARSLYEIAIRFLQRRYVH